MPNVDHALRNLMQVRCASMLPMATLVATVTLLSGCPAPGGSSRVGSGTSAGRLRAVGAKRAGPADLRIEVNRLAGVEGFHLAGRAGDRLGAKVDAKVGLREQARLDGAQSPWLREHGATVVLHRGHEGAVHVRAVDVNLGESEPVLITTCLGGGGLCRRGGAEVGRVLRKRQAVWLGFGALAIVGPVAAR